MAGTKLTNTMAATKLTNNQAHLNKGSLASKSRAVFPALLGFTICYQVVYQAIMFKKIQQDEELTDHCDANTNANSPECLELRLFRSWKRLEVESPSTPTETGEIRSVPVDLSNKDRSEQALLVQQVPLYASLLPTPSPTPWMLEASLAAAVAHGFEDLVEQDPGDVAVAKILEQQRDRMARWEEFDRVYNETVERINNRSNITAFGQSEIDMKAHIEAHLAASPGVQRLRAHERKEAFDRLYNSTLASLNNHSSISAYAQHLKEIQEKIEEQKARLPSSKRARVVERRAQFDKLYNETLASIANRSSVTPFIKKLGATQDKIQKRLDELKNRKHEGEDASPTKEQTLLDRINSFGWELCQAPHRRNRTSCEHFLASNSSASAEDSSKDAQTPSAIGSAAKAARRAQIKEQMAKSGAVFDAQLAKIHDGHAEWAKTFTDNIEAYDKDLCNEPERANYPICAKLLAAAAKKEADAAQEATTTATPALRGARRANQLRWSSVVAASAKKTKAGANAKPIAVTRAELRSLHWDAKIPKVACITAVPSGRDTKVKMQYFIDNFKLQRYEGERELVLLYRHSDADVEKLVKEYADGTLIKAVATRDHAEFPSTTALRYGAWSTRSDVIALWNFDEWHHPQRLSMQVRALALTSRPVSLLNRWTVLGSTDESTPSETILSDAAGWEGSIVGEASWMQSHWMPMLPNERQLLEMESQAGDVAQVDVPELLVYSMRSAGSWEGVLQHFGMHEPSATLAEIPAVCKDLAVEASGDLNANAHVDEENLNKAGAWLGEMYRTLSLKRHNVDKSLKLLCSETAADDHDPIHRRSMVEQVQHIASIRDEIVTHLHAVEALYHTKQ